MQLKVHLCLSDCGIQHQSILNLILRQRGGELPEEGGEMGDKTVKKSMEILSNIFKSFQQLKCLNGLLNLQSNFIPEI